MGQQRDSRTPRRAPRMEQGIRLVAVEGWRPAGDSDGSAFLRPMTDAELAAQAANC